MNIIKKVLNLFHIPKMKSTKSKSSFIGKYSLEEYLNEMYEKLNDPYDVADEVVKEVAKKAELIDMIIYQLPQLDNSNRFIIINALGDIGDSKAVKLLIERLRKDEYDSCHWAAAEALGKIGDREAIDVLVETVENENKDSSARKAAALSLGKIANRDDNNVLVAFKSIIDNDSGAYKYYEFQAGCIKSIGDIYGSEVLEYLIKAYKKKIRRINVG